MIDFHTHLLPAIDDGSQSVEMSMEMLSFYDDTVTDIALTPHFYPWCDRMEDFLSRREEAYLRLQKELPQTAPRLHLGAEFAYFDGIRYSTVLSAFLVEDSNLLLVEMPTAPWKQSFFDNLLYVADKQNIIPVLAHIDRYRLNKADWKMVEAFVKSGGKVQLNASAFGGPLAKKAKQWIQKGMVQFIGSDCHNATHRPPNLCQTIAQCKANGEEKILRYLQAQSDFYFPKSIER